MVGRTGVRPDSVQVLDDRETVLASGPLPLDTRSERDFSGSHRVEPAVHGPTRAVVTTPLESPTFGQFTPDREDKNARSDPYRSTTEVRPRYPAALRLPVEVAGSACASTFRPLPASVAAASSVADRVVAV